jgi:hypothetical protein
MCYWPELKHRQEHGLTNFKAHIPFKRRKLSAISLDYRSYNFATEITKLLDIISARRIQPVFWDHSIKDQFLYSHLCLYLHRDLLPSDFPLKVPYQTLISSHECYMPHQSYLYRFSSPINTRRRMQIKKLLTFSNFLLLSLSRNILLSTLFSDVLGQGPSICESVLFSSKYNVTDLLKPRPTIGL